MNRQTAALGGSDERTRLAFYLPALAAGGMERVTLLLAEALAARGFAVDIVLERKRGGYLDRVPSSVRLVVLESGAKWPAYLRLIRCWPREGIAQLLRLLVPGNRYIPLRRLLSLVAYMERARPAVVLAAHGRIPPLAIWARRIASVATRVVIIEHSTYSRWLTTFRDRRETYALLNYRRSLMHRLYPRADAIVAVSDGVSDDLATVADIDRALVSTLYNPVVPPELKRLADEPVEHPWFMPGAPPVVLAVGRLVEEKGFVSLIDAFALLRKRNTALRLMILGEGPQRAELETRVAALGLDADIELPGWVDNPYAFMARGGLFVLSSVFEGLPVALIEAMACGCPVVAADCPSGPREILAGGRFGPLVAVRDHHALADAMAQTLREPLPRATLQTRGMYFNVERAVDAYEALIERICADVC